MTQQLATATKDGSSWALDFGTLTADADGYLVVTRGSYRMSYAPDIRLPDVTITNVADDYALAGPPDTSDAATKAWRARWGNKAGVTPDQFPGLLLKAYLTLAAIQSQTPVQGLDRLSRLRSEPRLAMIWQTLASPTLKNVDPNDINGNFRSLVSIMATTPSSIDSQLMITDTETASIAAQFPNKV